MRILLGAAPLGREIYMGYGVGGLGVKKTVARRTVRRAAVSELPTMLAAVACEAGRRHRS